MIRILLGRIEWNNNPRIISFNTLPKVNNIWINVGQVGSLLDYKNMYKIVHSLRDKNILTSNDFWQGILTLGSNIKSIYTDYENESLTFKDYIIEYKQKAIKRDEYLHRTFLNNLGLKKVLYHIKHPKAKKLFKTLDRLIPKLIEGLVD